MILKSYEGGRFLRGTTKTEYGRLQIWNPKTLNSEAAAGLRASPPLSPQIGPASTTSGMSWGIDRQAFSITLASSNAINNWRQDALTIQTSIVDKEGNCGHTLERPELPCLVFFCEPNVQGPHGPTSRSYMIIQSTPQSTNVGKKLLTSKAVDRNTYINTKSCDCDKPNSQCASSVLESKSSRLIARRFESPNLAALGIFQRSKAPEVIKRLRHVTIIFPSWERKSIPAL